MLVKIGSITEIADKAYSVYFGEKFMSRED